MMVRFKKNKLLVLICLTLIFASDYSVFTGKVYSLSWYVLYYGKLELSLLLILIPYSSWSRNSNKALNVGKIMRKRLIGLSIVIFIYSCLIWGFNNTQLTYITRGISDTVFQILEICAGVSVALELEKDAVDVVVDAALVTYTLSYIIGLITMRGEFLSSAFQFEMSGGAHVYVELHALAFILGLSFVYMISHRRGNRINKLKAILCAIYFVISWKRIGLFAVVFVFGLNIILKRKNALYKYFANNLIAVAGVVACLIYVSFSASDLLIELLGKYGISMMGRNIIFSYFRQFCDFSPSYLGRGVGFVGKQFTFTTARELYNMASIRALHNDFFKVYLQIGFAGFIAWAFYWLSYIPKFIARKFGVNSGYIALMVIVYSFIIYTTDNMEGNYNYQFVLSMLLTTTCLTAYKKKGMA